MNNATSCFTHFELLISASCGGGVACPLSSYKCLEGAGDVHGSCVNVSVGPPASPLNITEAETEAAQLIQKIQLGYGIGIVTDDASEGGMLLILTSRSWCDSVVCIGSIYLCQIDYHLSAGLYSKDVRFVMELVQNSVSICNGH